MTLDEECRLSFYRPLTPLCEARGIWLMQHTQTRQLFVKKELQVYHLPVFRRLMEEPVPHIPRIFELIEDGETLLVIEEYFNGRTLQQLLEQDGPLPEAQVRDLASQLCRILRPLHEASPPIVHRDIKPSNLLLTPDGTLKLLDLNAAKFGSEHAGQDTELIGTAGYAAPEQYGFGSSGPPADIYAIGVLIHVLLTGQPPQRRCSCGSLGPVVERCTRMDPTARYEGVDSLLAALESGTKPTEPRRRTCLPGLSRSKPLRCLFSAVGYLFLLLASLILEIPDAGPLILWLNRLSFFLFFFLPILFLGNFRDIQGRLGISAIPWLPLRIAVRIGVCLLLAFADLTLLTVLERLLR